MPHRRPLPISSSFLQGKLRTLAYRIFSCRAACSASRCLAELLAGTLIIAKGRRSSESVSKSASTNISMAVSLAETSTRTGASPKSTSCRRPLLPRMLAWVICAPLLSRRPDICEDGDVVKLVTILEIVSFTQATSSTLDSATYLKSSMNAHTTVRHLHAAHHHTTPHAAHHLATLIRRHCGVGVSKGGAGSAPGFNGMGTLQSSLVPS